MEKIQKRPNARKIIPNGTVFGKLTVIGVILPHARHTHMRCKCVCGTEFSVRASHLRVGQTVSCGSVSNGCIPPRYYKHGLRKSPLYQIWFDMHDRCLNKKRHNYHRYGGRGIKICARWYDVANFHADMNAGWKSDLQLDRIDNNGDYCKENCKWSTRSENMQNTEWSISRQQRLDSKVTSSLRRTRKFIVIKQQLLGGN